MKKLFCDKCGKEYHERDERPVYIKIAATDVCPPDTLAIDLCPDCITDLFRKYTK